MRQPPTLVLLLSDNIMNIFLWMDVKVRDNACCSDVSKEFYVATGWPRVVDVQYMYTRLCKSKCVRNDQVTQKHWRNDSVSYTVSTLICIYDM